MLSRHLRRVFVSLTTVLLLAAPEASAQERGSIGGNVLDPVGATVSGASVTLLREDAPVAQATSDARGEYAFASLTAGRYQVEVSAPGFQVRRSDPIFVGASGRTLINV
jgi:hypothetical protein